MPSAASPALAAAANNLFYLDRSVGPNNVSLSVHYDGQPMEAVDWPHSRNVLTFIAYSSAVQGAPLYVVTLQASAGMDLSVGMYPDTGATPGGPSFDISGSDALCQTGWFRIDELAWDGTTSNPTRLAATFQCFDGAAGPTSGEIRVDSTIPIRSRVSSPDYLTFARTLAGTPAATQSLSWTGLGPSDVHEGSATITGQDAADFSITADDCSGTTLALGAPCAISIGFAPADGSALLRRAFLVLPDDTLNGSREVELDGSIMRPTTLTISAGPAPNVLPRSPSVVTHALTPAPTDYANPGIQYFIDGVLRGTAYGSAPFVPDLLGRHTIQARYLGSPGFAPSTSNTITQVTEVLPSIALSAAPWPELGRFNVTAVISDTGGFGPLTGGTILLEDVTAGVVLAVSPDIAEVQGLTIIGTHVIRARYTTTHPYVLPAQATISLTGLPDAIPPTASPPLATLLSNTASGTAGEPVRLSWSGYDHDSGVASYELAERRDGGAWVSLSSGSAVASFTKLLPTGHTYQFRVRPTDGYGKIGAWAVGASFRLAGYAESSARIAYAGTWHTTTSLAYQGGHDRSATASGARATFRFTGKNVSWLSAIGPTRGYANVYVDGLLVARVNLHAATNAARRIVWSRGWATNGPHVITIRVAGTRAHPRVDLDGFVVLS